MENTLKIQNDFAWLITDDIAIKQTLWGRLRVRVKGYYHNPLYKQGRWDGFVEYFSKSGGRFLTGLLPEVIKILEEHNFSYKTVDCRKFFDWQYKSIDEDFLNEWLPPGEKPVTLYDYQVESVNKIIQDYRGLVKLPTSAGKTYILISILKCLPPKFPVLFMSKGVSLVDQNYQEMKKWGLGNVGRVYDKYREPNYITCINTNKASINFMSDILPKFKGIVVDEVHDCMSAIPKAAYKKLENAVLRVGISATPFKYDGKDINQKLGVKGYFGGVLLTDTTESGHVTTKYLQDKSILSKSECTFFKIIYPKIPHEPYGDAVTLGIAENMDFAQKVTKLVKSLEGRTLILVDRINQGDLLAKLIPNAYWLQGETHIDERSEIFKKLKFDEHAVAIVMQQIVSAGINVFIHNLVNAAGGKAEHSIIQRMGRGLRVAKDKDGLKYYDFIFDINDYLYKHSMTRIATLEKEGHTVKIVG